eukprot:g19914.t1
MQVPDLIPDGSGLRRPAADNMQVPACAGVLAEDPGSVTMKRRFYVPAASDYTFFDVKPLAGELSGANSSTMVACVTPAIAIAPGVLVTEVVIKRARLTAESAKEVAINVAVAQWQPRGLLPPLWIYTDSRLAEVYIVFPRLNRIDVKGQDGTRPSVRTLLVDGLHAIHWLACSKISHWDIRQPNLYWVATSKTDKRVLLGDVGNATANGLA